MIVTETAYAKVNLFLGITGKREDGFHDISTVMQSVSLADKIELSVTASANSEIRLTVCDPRGLCPGIPTDAGNLAVRAAARFLECLPSSYRIEIMLEKQIPSEAGLGGGSSDAAAVLRAMARCFPFALSREELFRMAAELGSDVPFCLLGGAALCEGRGERMTPIASSLPLYFLIGKGDGSVSTPSAYRRMDAMYADFNGSVPLPIQDAARTAHALASGEYRELASSLYNIFEDAVLTEVPSSLVFKRAFLRCGADAALLSGSGSAVFGLYRDRTLADAAMHRIPGSVYAEGIPHHAHHAI